MFSQHNTGRLPRGESAVLARGRDCDTVNLDFTLTMDITSWQEIQKNEVVRKRLAKRIVRDCFRDGEFEQFHSGLAALDDDAVKTIMTDAVNRTYVLLSKLSNAMGDMIVERLKEQDDVPNWDDPEDARLFG